MTTQKRLPRLIIGVGNLLLRDEGVGVHVTSALRDRELPDDVELWDGSTASFDLLDTLAGRRQVIIIDAVRTGSEPAPYFVSPPKISHRAESKSHPYTKWVYWRP